MLPASTPVVRDLYSHKTGHKRETPLTPEEVRAQHDLRTIFYDVFLDRESRLRAVGPPLVNLKKHVFPMRVRLESSERSYRSPAAMGARNGYRVSTYDFGLQAPVSSQPVALHVDANRMAELEAEIAPFELDAVQVQLVTLQRDNEAPWIRQWAEYYARIGCKRVVLYDNNSRDTSIYTAIARELEGLCDVLVIPWNFPYGPTRSWQNMFCQCGSLTHVALAVGESEWIANFDVDEYLMPPAEHESIQQFLDETVRPWHGFVRFDSHIFPNIRDSTGLPCGRDYVYRETRSRRGAEKYLVRTKRVRTAGPHDADVGLSLKRRVRPRDASFLHLHGLTTNWKRIVSDRSQVVDFDAAKHIEDTRLRDAFDRLGVG